MQHTVYTVANTTPYLNVKIAKRATPTRENLIGRYTATEDTQGYMGDVLVKCQRDETNRVVVMKVRIRRSFRGRCGSAGWGVIHHHCALLKPPRSFTVKSVHQEG